MKVTIEDFGPFTEVDIEFTLRFDKPIQEAQKEITEIIKQIQEIIKERERRIG